MRAVDVWPDNWHAAQVFAAMGTQWRVSELAGGTLRHWGLRYEALQPVLAEFADTLHAQPHPELMRRLRHLEQRALHHVNRKA